jgi:hypothetical protein
MTITPRLIPKSGGCVQGSFRLQAARGGEFRNQRAAALLDERIEQGLVFGRVTVGEPAAEDGNGSAFVAEGAAVGRGIDAAGTSGDDGQSAAAEDSGESLGLLDAVGRGIARADNGDRVLVGGAGLDAAADVEEGRRVVDGVKELGVLRVRLGDEPGANLGSELEFGLDLTWRPPSFLGRRRWTGRRRCP